MNHGEIDKIMQRYWGIKKVPHDRGTKEFLNHCRSHSAELDGKSYKYYQQGSMVPIAQDLLAQGFEVVLFDVPAHGEAIGARTDPAEVRDVIRKIAQQLRPIHAIICHSLGGVWALCAWNDDCRAKTVISIASPSTHKFLVEKFVQLYQFGSEITEGIVKELESRFGETVWIDFSPSEIVKRIGVPGLIIHGKNDDYVPPAHAEQLRSNWNNATLEIVEGVSHFDVVGSSRVRGLVTKYLRESV
jgi:pimeloyl-ACP methyl ester carboxylesterase